MKSGLKIILFVFVFFLFSCKKEKSIVLSEQDKEIFLALGDSLSTAVQNALLQNVGSAIEQGGTDYAVEFCNLKAITLTDSLSVLNKIKVQRLTDKNRNTQNAIQTETDSLAWERIKSEKTAFIEQDDKAEIYYYKPIMMGMPACIKCHGSKSDISESTQNIIRLYYPQDKAIDYKIGDLRGMWKIKFE